MPEASQNRRHDGEDLLGPIDERRMYELAGGGLLRLHASCEVRGDVIVARRCRECGAFAVAVPGYLIGRLPPECREGHGNVTIEVPVVVPGV